MAAVHLWHVDSPENDVAPTDRRDVKAWDGEEILEIPPSTPDRTVSIESRHECHFYGAKIEAWRSAWAQECLVVCPGKQPPNPPTWEKNPTNLPEMNFIALVQKKEKANPCSGGCKWTVMRFCTTQWKLDSFSLFTGIKGSNSLRHHVDHMCCWQWAKNTSVYQQST